MFFVTELSILLKANIPLIKSLEILIKKYSIKNQQILLSLKKYLSEGLSFSQALAKHPNEFDLLTCQLIRVGEETASLAKVCERIGQYQEKTKLLKMRLKKALFYPVFVLAIAFIITGGLLIFIVPQFERLFESVGAKLPALTQFILSCSAFLQNHFVILITGIIFIVMILFFYRKFLISQLSFIFLKFPLLGKLYEKNIISRFSYTLSILLSSHMTLTQSLSIALNVLQQRRYEKAIAFIIDDVIKGEKISDAFEKTGVFPGMFLQFIIIGEQSGQLKFFLERIAEYYDEQTQQHLNTLTLLLEPMIMLILGLCIGGLVVALYLPIFELGSAF